MPWEKPQIDKAKTVSLVKQAAGFVGPAVSIGITVLEAVKTFVEGMLNFLVAVIDPTSAALQAAIDTAREILEDLTKGAGSYFLALPIRDVNLTVKGPYTSPGATQVTVTNVQVGEKIWPLNLTKDGQALSTDDTETFAGSGGNLGFVQELADSLSDPGDLLRPRFDEDAYVAGVIFLYGASSYTRIKQLVKHLIMLFTKSADSLDDQRLPIPRGLNARFVPKIIGRTEEIENRFTQDDTPVHPYAVKLAWQPADVNISLFGGKARYKIRRVVIMRAPIPLLKMPTSVSAKYVIKEFDFNDNLLNLFYDDTIKLNQKYYYAVGYLLDELDADGKVVSENSIPFDIAQIQVNVPEQIGSLPSRGIPPDWMMSPSPLAYIPPIMDLVNKINTFLDQLEEGNKNVKKNIEKYVAFLKKEINRNTAWVEEVLQTIQAIVEALDLPDVYVGMLPFSGKGGNNLMLSTLAQSLSDTGDPNRPPFDRGDEYVGGFVIYAGSETVGEAEKFWNLVKPLFGVQMPAAAKNTMKQAHDAIDYAAGEVQRQIDILDDLSAEFGKPPVPEDATGTAVGPDLQPSREDGSVENKPRRIVFDDSLKPKTTEEEF